MIEISSDTRYDDLESSLYPKRNDFLNTEENSVVVMSGG